VNVIEADFPRGSCPIHAFGDLDDRSAPIVLLFMDAFGPRPALFDIAEALAGAGYRILLPDLFYEHLPFEPLRPDDIFAGGKGRERLMTMLRGLDQKAVRADVGALLAYCDRRLGEGAPIGATGYCMGGRYALTAATLSPRVVFAASFHGGNLAPETGEGVHQALSGVRARVYVGVADTDPTFSAAEENRLGAALREANVDHAIETYADAAHGFVMSDLPVHDPIAAGKHWLRLSEGLRAAFAEASQRG